MNPMVGFAVKAARRAGDIINRAAENIEQLKMRGLDKFFVMN